MNDPAAPRPDQAARSGRSGRSARSTRSARSDQAAGSTNPAASDAADRSGAARAIDAGRPPAQTALFDRVSAAGAELANTAGWLVAQSFAGQSAHDELRAARERVAVADAGGYGVWQVEGALDRITWHQPLGEAARLTQLAPGQGIALAAAGAGAGADTDAGASAWAYRLRDDLALVVASADSHEAVAHSLERSVATTGNGEPGGHVSATDLSHGSGQLLIIGPHARPLLAKVCGLDLSDRALPVHGARQTSVAHTRQTVIRRDFGPLPAFLLLGGRASAGYLWDVVLRAGAEWQILPIGAATIDRLAAEPTSPAITDPSPFTTDATEGEQ